MTKKGLISAISSVVLGIALFSVSATATLANSSSSSSSQTQTSGSSATATASATASASVKNKIKIHIDGNDDCTGDCGHDYNHGDVRHYTHASVAPVLPATGSNVLGFVGLVVFSFLVVLGINKYCVKTK